MGYTWGEAAAVDTQQQQDALMASAFATPFYRHHWVTKPKAWHELPILRDSDLKAGRQNFPENVFGGRLTIPERNLLYIWPPSGALKPDISIYMGMTDDERTHWVDVMTRQWTILGLGAEDVVQVLSWSNDPFVAVLTTAVGGASAYGSPAVDELLGILTVRLELVPSEARRTLATAELLHPAALFADSAHVEAVCQLLGTKTLADLGYRSVVLRSVEWADAKTRIKREKEWQIPVRRILEIPYALGYGLDCERNPEGVHFARDHYLIEVTDDDGHTVTETTGYLTITPLFLRSHPIIRYQSSIKGHFAQHACGCLDDGWLFIPESEGP
ncbi:MAG: hypothetical protein C7B45_04685 [Sulfobacillus acidophilus]|uniref:AMP-dependent synthetase/ligase domain-containing protein n=1 Tax=Sulfobacillus acidophilus TaxID=53633 RepID=A0A2T2WL20_9FIRM|nr:MAG: hypothetical protein C7B45_04685 [Sulfobacillus acidophilus]